MKGGDREGDLRIRLIFIPISGQFLEKLAELLNAMSTLISNDFSEVLMQLGRGITGSVMRDQLNVILEDTISNPGECHAYVPSRATGEIEFSRKRSILPALAQHFFPLARYL